MLYPTSKIKKPTAQGAAVQRKAYPAQMKMQAATMAAEGEEAKAPIVPTTNLKVAAAKQAASPASLPTAPQGGTMQAMGLTSTGYAGPVGAGPATMKQADPANTPFIPVAGADGAIKGPGGQTIQQGTKNFRDDVRTLPSQTVFDPEAELEKATQELLTRDYSTADEERLIQEMMRQQAGQGAADVNARLGASGFGTSGALGALTSNVRSEAARKAAADIFDVQRQARGDRRADLGVAADLSAQQREQARQDAELELNMPKNEDADGDGKNDVTGLTPEEERTKQTRINSYQTRSHVPEALAWGAGAKGSTGNPWQLNAGQWKTAPSDLQLERSEYPGTWFSPVTGQYYYNETTTLDEYNNWVV